VIFVAGDGKSEYQEFIAQAVEEFSKYKVTKIAIIAFIEDEDSESLSGYWNMNHRDKIQAESVIRYDAIDDFMKANAGRYCVKESEDDE